MRRVDGPSQAQDTDLIAAIATPPGQGGIGIVRVSGAGAADVVTRLIDRPLQARRATLARVTTPSGDVLDEGMVLYFPAPHSFTGEDVVELQLHGSPVVLQQVLDILGRAGVRLARPGEFSERAYLNDKLDLAQAEAIADLIGSASRQAARAAARSLQGEFSRAVRELADAVEHARLLVEATIDFPEEDEDFLAAYNIPGVLTGVYEKLAALLRESRRSAVLRQGCDIAIVGLPNAGKSSLLNALSGEQAAIVSDIPGTTRDLLKVDLVLDGLPVRLIDTAGLRVSTDAVERIGVARARDQIALADVIVLLVDGTLADPEQSLADTLKLAGLAVDDARVLVAVNKQDVRPRRLALDRVQVPISAKLAQGLEALVDLIKQGAGLGDGEVTYLARTRHVSALDAALQKVADAQHIAARGVVGLELVAEELRLAHERLGEIVGITTSDELLGKIFAEFCIGK